MSAETVGLPLTERLLGLVNESGTWEGSGAVPSLQICVQVAISRTRGTVTASAGARLDMAVPTLDPGLIFTRKLRWRKA